MEIYELGLTQFCVMGLFEGNVGVQQKFVENPIRKISIPASSLLENMNNEHLIYG